MSLKQHIVIWYDQENKKYFLDCEKMYLKRKHHNPKIALITRLNLACEEKEKFNEVLNMKNICILPEAYNLDK